MGSEAYPAAEYADLALAADRLRGTRLDAMIGLFADMRQPDYMPSCTPDQRAFFSAVCWFLARIRENHVAELRATEGVAERLTSAAIWDALEPDSAEPEGSDD